VSSEVQDLVVRRVQRRTVCIVILRVDDLDRRRDSAHDIDAEMLACALSADDAFLKRPATAATAALTAPACGVVSPGAMVIF
jgi:hypothetical protein